jgi:hypothetical protein
MTSVILKNCCNSPLMLAGLFHSNFLIFKIEICPLILRVMLVYIPTYFQEVIFTKQTAGTFQEVPSEGGNHSRTCGIASL